MPQPAWQSQSTALGTLQSVGAGGHLSGRVLPTTLEESWPALYARTVMQPSCHLSGCIVGDFDLNLDEVSVRTVQAVGQCTSARASALSFAFSGAIPANPRYQIKQLRFANMPELPASDL